MSENNKPWYSKAGNVFVMIVVIAVLSVAVYLAFPYVRELVPNDKRDKAITLYNVWNRQGKEFWINYDEYMEIASRKKKTGTKDEMIKYLSNAKNALDKIDPYQPIGVDPALAAAVKDFKAAAFELIDIVTNFEKKYR